MVVYDATSIKTLKRISDILSNNRDMGFMYELKNSGFTIISLKSTEL